MKVLMVKLGFIVILIYMVAIFQGCKDKGTNVVTTDKGTLSGTLTLPYSAPNKVLYVAIDNDYNGDNGSKYSYSGNCSSGSTVNYTINNVVPGTYYVYAAVFVKSNGSSGPQNGDFIGIYGGSFINPPATPNVTITSGGKKTCNFALSVMGDTSVLSSNTFSFNTTDGSFSASGIFDSTATSGSGAGWYDNNTIAAYNYYSSNDGSISLIMFKGTLSEQNYSMPSQVEFRWALHFNPNDINSLQDKICISSSGSLNLSTYNSSQAKGTFSGSGYYAQNSSQTVNFSNGMFDVAITSGKISKHLPKKINLILKEILGSTQRN